MSNSFVVASPSDVQKEEDSRLVQLQSAAERRFRNAVSLRASWVHDFSSQYGSECSMSYTAENLRGCPTVYPVCSDNPSNFQFRTYGRWSGLLPSSLKWSNILPFGTAVESQEFVEFSVESVVYPVELWVYEVMSPSAIVKILCYSYIQNKFITLWQGEPKPLGEKTHRFYVQFPLQKVHSNLFRIEFNTRHLDYFNALDCLILFGEIPWYHKPGETLPTLSSPSKDEQPDCSVDGCCIKESPENQKEPTAFYSLPDEVLYLIINYLDLQSLCRLSQVSRTFKKLCYDPVLFKELNLQLYWTLIRDDTLSSFEGRTATSLKKLNLSWCGGGKNFISPKAFIKFVETSCFFLTRLQLANCCFFEDSCMKAVAKTCIHLKELDLSGCRIRDESESEFTFRHITKLKNLTYLNLYRTNIDEYTLRWIIRSLPLEHLLLGNCHRLKRFDEIAKEISENLKKLKTLDLFHGSSLTCVGIQDLAECTELVELDIGFCNLVDANCGCIKMLVSSCPKLKKLSLNALRSIRDEDLIAIATHCKDMEQLDLLGNREVGIVGVEKVLSECTKLKLLDITFCYAFGVQLLKARFPNVVIQGLF